MTDRISAETAREFPDETLPQEGAKTAHFCPIWFALCSTKIAEDIGRYAQEQQLSDEDALKVGMEQKAKEFVEKGAEIYANG